MRCFMRIIITLMVLAASFAASSAQAGIFRWRDRASAMQVAAAPSATATVITASNQTGYQSFSYQPAPVAAAPAAGYVATRPQAGGAFHDAGWKIRGF